jgi:hypothetical protein
MIEEQITRIIGQDHTPAGQKLPCVSMVCDKGTDASQVVTQHPFKVNILALRPHPLRIEVPQFVNQHIEHQSPVFGASGPLLIPCQEPLIPFPGKRPRLRPRKPLGFAALAGADGCDPRLDLGQPF